MARQRFFSFVLWNAWNKCVESVKQSIHHKGPKCRKKLCVYEGECLHLYLCVCEGETKYGIHITRRIHQKIRTHTLFTYAKLNVMLTTRIASADVDSIVLDFPRSTCSWYSSQLFFCVVEEQFSFGSQRNVDNFLRKKSENSLPKFNRRVFLS